MINNIVKKIADRIGNIFGLFLKYVFWLLKISFNFLLFLIVDLPQAIFTVPGWTHYKWFFMDLFEGLLSQLGYWAARYIVAEEWVYDGYNAPEFENHYYQWRFFFMVRNYWRFALSIIFKIILGWVLAIIHFFVWSLYRLFRYRSRYYKKLVRTLEFIKWKIYYAFGARINMSINNIVKISAFHADFKYFDRKGWYTYGRDYIFIIPENMRSDYVPVKFRIKKEVNDLISDEKREALKKNLSELRGQINSQFPKIELLNYLRNYDGIWQDSNKSDYDFFSKLQESADREHLSLQEKLLKKGTRLYVTTKDGDERELSSSEKKELLKKISLVKTKSSYRKLIYELAAISIVTDETAYRTRIEKNGNKVFESSDRNISN